MWMCFNQYSQLCYKYLMDNYKIINVNRIEFHDNAKVSLETSLKQNTIYLYCHCKCIYVYKVARSVKI